jgi:hypothetical protein
MDRVIQIDEARIGDHLGEIRPNCLLKKHIPEFFMPIRHFD